MLLEIWLRKLYSFVVLFYLCAQHFLYKIKLRQERLVFFTVGKWCSSNALVSSTSH